MSSPRQHTPGPWVRSRDIDNSPDVHILAEDGALVATVSAMISFNPVSRDSEEMKANARLIAEAPNLLAALRKAETWIATFSDQVGNPTGPLANDLAEIRAAIARATGQPAT